MALASIFSPDPSDWDQPPLAPMALSSLHRQCFAIARQFLPDRRTQQDLPSIALQKTLPFPIQGIAHGWHWHYQIVLPATPSTGTPSSERTKSLRIPVAVPLACAHRQICEHRTSHPIVGVLAAAPQHASKNRP